MQLLLLLLKQLLGRRILSKLRLHWLLLLCIVLNMAVPLQHILLRPAGM